MSNHHQRVLDTLSKVASKDGIEKPSLFDTIEALKRPELAILVNSSPVSVCIYNYTSRRYEYFSDNIRNIIGYTPEMLTKMDGVQFVMSLYHPEHSAIFATKIVTELAEHFQKSAMEGTIKNFRYSTVAKIKTYQGNYVWLLMQMMVIDTDPNNFPMLSLTFVSDITEIKKDDLICHSIAQRNEQDMFEPVQSTFIHPELESFALSKQELKILSLLNQGKSTEEIADLLFVSIHTVYTHRRNIISKTGSKNVADLLRIVSSNSVL